MAGVNGDLIAPEGNDIPYGISHDFRGPVHQVSTAKIHIEDRIAGKSKLAFFAVKADSPSGMARRMDDLNGFLTQQQGFPSLQHMIYTLFVLIQIAPMQIDWDI